MPHGDRGDDGAIRERLRAISVGATALRISTPTHPVAAGEAVVLNTKKLYRLYREERLMVRNLLGGRKRALGTRAPMAIPQDANQRWSLDFVSDALACSRRFRILTVVDDFSRECLALVIDNSLSGIRGCSRARSRVVGIRGRPFA